MAASFVTPTLNPAVDRSGTVRGLVAVEILRCEDPRMDPGGGGINVAHVLTRLGADVVAVFAAVGSTGSLLTSPLEREKITFQAVPVPGETRESFHPGTGLAMPADITRLLPTTAVGPACHPTPATAGD